MKPLGRKELPEPLTLGALLGPSFILLGLGLGSGELILWPYLVAHFGLGIIWGAVLGVAFQFFLNMEVERYALVTGESVFVGLARRLGKIVPAWFLLSTLVPWMWPGIVASSAKIIGAILGTGNTRFLNIGLLILIGAVLSLGPVLYRTVERLQKVLILLGVPFIFGLTVYLAKVSDWQALFWGILGRGEGYLFLPAGISLSSFLAAFAYSGAGGNLNLAQAFYVKEKGYGMGKYSGRITSLLTGEAEEIALEGNTFEVNENSLSVFRRWWKLINLEHFLVFALMGILTISLLALLAFATVYGHGGLPSGIGFLFKEAGAIGRVLGAGAGIAFLGTVAVMLSATQLTVLDATSRIMAENLAIAFHKRFPLTHLTHYFYGVLWFQIGAGVLIFLAGFSEPLFLLTLGAVLNAGAMFVSLGLVVFLNLTALHQELRPARWRLVFLAAAFLFFGGFTAFMVVERFF